MPITEISEKMFNLQISLQLQIRFNLFTGNSHPLLVRRVPRIAQDRQLEDVRRLQGGGLRREGGAERGLAESQVVVQNSAIVARKRTEQQTDFRLPG